MRYLAIVLFTVFFVGNALGSQCPTLIKQIDHQLQSAQLDIEAEAKVKELRDRGESLHNEGKHSEAEIALRKAIDELDAAL
ncbi:hypothetical protein QPM17_20995 [Marinobacter sp. TBZ242]|uniref:DUF1090 domain-containing protein n=1 Tax=Marinobacter azerbaijanicus TaxID=3050455 RepID=A0ABT7IHL1_9GAMM|nr:hypothetical protein [Marinobacter sp. TBZ242]MDL0433626.1 hypothetical protein [Marinobacter sp. TBZ242]